MLDSMELKEPHPGAAGGEQEAEIQRLLNAARRTQAQLREVSHQITEQAALQGRTDSFASVTGSTSLERGASELAALIADLEGRRCGGSAQR